MYKIIIVDDEAAVRNSIKNNINWEEQGFEVLGDYENGKEVIEFIESVEDVEKCRPDVMLTDICMPFIDGIELTRYVTTRFPNTKALILTGFDQFQFAQQALKLGAYDYILKPITPKELIKILNEVKLKLDEEKINKESLSKLKLQLKESMPVLRERFLNQIISGYITEEKLVEKLEYFDVNLYGSNYLPIVIDLNDYSSSKLYRQETDDELIYFAILNLCEEILSKENDDIVFRNNSNKIVILLSNNDSKVLNEIATRLSEQIRSDIERYFKFTVTIGIGTVISELKALNSSYKRAVSALDYRFILGTNQVININDFEGNIDVNLVYDKEYNKKLITEIKIGTIPNIVITIDELFDAIEKSYYSIEGSYLKIQRIIVQILSALNDLGYDELEIFGRKFSPFTEIYHFKTLDEIRDWIKGLCMNIAVFISDKRNDISNIQAIKAEEYIKNNYHDEHLSLNDICKHLLVSTSYFSMIFKSHTNSTFIEYLTRVRVEKAMELLKTTRIKTYEIASRVGYSDAHYFSSIFKKSTGFTPTEYREKVLV